MSNRDPQLYLMSWSRLLFMHVSYVVIRGRYGFNLPLIVNLTRLSRIWITIDLSNNVLIREIPVLLGRLLSLKELDLGGNRFGEVGLECFIQHRNFEVLDISNNLLKCVLAYIHFVNLSRLSTLLIDHNEHLLLDMKSN